MTTKKINNGPLKAKEVRAMAQQLTMLAPRNCTLDIEEFANYFTITAKMKHKPITAQITTSSRHLAHDQLVDILKSLAQRLENLKSTYF